MKTPAIDIKFVGKNNLPIAVENKDAIEPIEEIDIGSKPLVKLLVGSHNRIILDKLYGPACVEPLTIVWEGSDWNIRNKKRLIQEQTKAQVLADVDKKFKEAWNILQNNKNWNWDKQIKEERLRDIAQREDELCLVYSEIFEFSVNKSRQKLAELSYGGSVGSNPTKGIVGGTTGSSGSSSGLGHPHDNHTQETTSKTQEQRNAQGKCDNLEARPAKRRKK